MLETQGLDSGKPSKIIFDIEEDELDEITFNLADKGLGFHYNENLSSEMIVGQKKVSNFELNKQKLISKKNISPIDLPQTSTGAALPGLEKRELEVKENSLESGSLLEKLNEREATMEREHKEVTSLKKSSVEKVMLAWCVDIFLIFLFVSISIVLFFTSTQIPYEEVLILVEYKEGVIFSLIFFSVFYLFYFSILDLTASPGKLLFGTKLVSTNGGRLKMKQTFLRSFVILCSPLLLFLPLVFNFHDSLSKTSSVEETW